MATRKTAEPLPDPQLDEKLVEAFGSSDMPTFGVKTLDAEPPPAADYFAGEMIYTLLARVMNEVSYVGKTGFNENQRYNFRGVDAVVNALGPAMRKHGVVPVPTLDTVTYRDTRTTGDKPTREVTLKVSYRFFAPDGSFVQAFVPGESLDQADKGTAKAMSVAYRIALLQVFALPTDEPDPDSSYHTRDGVGAMPVSTRDMVLAAIQGGPVSHLYQAWAVVMEHSAAERVVDAVEKTWAEIYGDRWTAEIEQVETWATGGGLKSIMEHAGVLGMRHGDSRLGDALKARAAYLKERAEKSMAHCLEQITAAATIEELTTAIGCVTAQVETFAISERQGAELLAIASDKGVKLAEQEHAREVAAAKHALDAFRARAAAAIQAGDLMPEEDRAIKIMGAIEDLLTGDFSGDPAANHGVDGFVAVYDAIKAAGFRDKTIDGDAVKLLLDLLTEHADTWGVSRTELGMEAGT